MPLESEAFDLSPSDVLFREVMFLLLSAFIDYNIAHRPRVCNKVLNELVRIGSLIEPSAHMLWHDSVLTDIMMMVLNYLE